MKTLRLGVIWYVIVTVGFASVGYAAGYRSPSLIKQAPEPRAAIDPRLQIFAIDPETGLLQIHCSATEGALQPSTVRISEDFTANEVHIEINGTHGKRRIDQVSGYDVELCGNSNWFSYQLAGTSTTLERARTFRVLGGDSFDYVKFNFATSAYGQYVHVAERVSIELDLKNLSDQVEMHLFELDDADLRVDANLGSGNDGLSFVSYPGELKGNLTVNVEGDSGDDTIFLDFSDLDVPQGRELNLQVAGEQYAFPGPSNEPLHGKDKIEAYFSGLLNGRLSLRIWGDDDLLRFPDYECMVGGENCVYLSDASRIVQAVCDGLPFPSINVGETEEGYCDLEEALRTDPHYAADQLHVFIGIDPGSIGHVAADVDAGLSSDTAELILRAPANSSVGTSAQLSGGQLNSNVWDACYVENAAAINCEEIDASISVF